MTRRLLIILVGLAGAAAIAGCGGSHRPAPRLRRRAATSTPAPLIATKGAVDRPNIVFVLTDDLTTNLLRYMPHVRQLQRQGVSFSHYVVSDSLCCPSRASIFTGELPHDTGVLTNTRPLGGWGAFQRHGDEHRTFATVLRAQGYRTAFLGKYLNEYHAGMDGVPPGWTDWAGTDDGYTEYDYKLNVDGRLVVFGDRPSDSLTDVLSRMGTRIVDRASREDRPFFLELATFAPHRPAVPAPRDAHRFPGLRMPRGGAFDRASTDPPPWLRGRKRLT